MKIVFISPSFPPLRGGISDYIFQLAKALSVKVEVHVITTKGLGQLDIADVIVHDIVKVWSWHCLMPILRTIKNIDPHSVFFQDGKEQPSNKYLIMFLPGFIGWLFRIPSYLIVHEIEGTRQKLQARLSSGIVGVESSYKKYFDRLTPKSRFHWLPIGSNIPSANVTQEQRQAYRISLGVSVDDLLVGYFGFISPRKGFDALLEAITHLNKTRSVWLIAIGSGEAEIPIKFRGPSVITTGYLGYDEVAIALSSTDVNAFPFVDGSAWRYTSLLAALTQDTPIVTTPGLAQSIPGVIEVYSLTPSGLALAIENAADLGKLERSVVPSWSEVADRLITIAKMSERDTKERF